jgi:hypothetical protein
LPAPASTHAGYLGNLRGQIDDATSQDCPATNGDPEGHAISPSTPVVEVIQVDGVFDLKRILC